MAVLAIQYSPTGSNSVLSFLALLAGKSHASNPSVTGNRDWSRLTLHWLLSFRTLLLQLKLGYALLQCCVLDGKLLIRCQTDLRRVVSGGTAGSNTCSTGRCSSRLNSCWDRKMLGNELQIQISEQRCPWLVLIVIRGLVAAVTFIRYIFSGQSEALLISAWRSDGARYPYFRNASLGPDSHCS